MKNLHYELHYFENPDYPIIFHYNHLRKGVNNIQHHWHMNIELLFVTVGIIEVEIDGKITYATQGDIVVINSNAIHKIDVHTDDAFYYCLIIDYRFSTDLGFDTVNTQFTSINSDPEIKNIYQLIINESHSMKPHYKKAVRALCHTMLILLDRNQVQHRDLVKHSDSKAQSNNIESIKTAIEFIHTNYHLKFSLDTMSQHVAVSKFHMCRIFKEITGITISQYTNQVRLVKARNHIVNDDISVSEAADITGFNSISYFTKSFKSFFGYPPSKSKSQESRTGPNLIAAHTSESNNEFKSLVSKYL